MKDTYWNQRGKYQSDYDRLADALMPATGACDTVAGEMIRAASRLAYDFYNNGCGNNTRGAVNYLRNKGVIDQYTYRTVLPLASGGRYRGDYDGDLIQIAFESIVDKTMEKILNNMDLITENNSEDLFDF